MNRDSDICRICLQTIPSEEKGEYIFESNEITTSIASKIYALSGSYIDKEQNLPEKICSECHSSLMTAYTFRIKCLESEEKLKMHAEKPRFKEEWMDTYSWIRPTKTDYHAFCLICQENFRFGYGKKFDIKQHFIQPKHIINRSKIKFHDFEFNMAWLDIYKWIRISKQKTTFAYCTICEEDFSIAKTGKKEVEKHMKNEKHVKILLSNLNENPDLDISNNKNNIIDDGNKSVKRSNTDSIDEDNGSPFKKIKSGSEHVEINYKNDLKCEVCNKLFKGNNKKSSLKRHLIKWHNCKPDDVVKGLMEKKSTIDLQEGSGNASLVCDQKPASYYDTIHSLPSHSKERPFICELCLRGFVDELALKQHMASTQNHSTDKCFRCDICNITFATNMMFKDHKQSLLHKHKRGDKEFFAQYGNVN